tara:strand:- start:3333 stop:3953 length:621 start_codon:yes stop_codon:yes gene_type:complete
MASTTIDLDTELSAVNSILGAIGQAPVTVLVFDNPEIGLIYNLLRDANVDTQAEGWHFNTEKHVAFQPDSVTGKIAIANDVLQLDVSEGWTRREYNVVRRNGVLYDKIDHTDDFSTIESIDLDVVKLVAFEDLPTIFRRYITNRASRTAATQLVANPQLVKLLAQQEALSRAALMEYECNQGNHSMFGFPENTVYQTYQPWRNLRR